MIRLVLPLLIFTLLFWGVIFALPKRLKRSSMSAASQFAVSFAVAVAALLLVSALFYFGGFINVRS